MSFLSDRAYDIGLPFAFLAAALSHVPHRPSIDQQVQELREAGWKPQSGTVWESPSGQLFRGPHGAWVAMKKGRT